jgi:hypothetical protein
LIETHEYKGDFKEFGMRNFEVRCLRLRAGSFYCLSQRNKATRKSMMRRYLVFFTVFAVALPSNGLRAVQEGSIAIVGGTLVDVRSGEERKDIAVLVREGRIAEVGTTGNVKVPKDTAIIDARGKWILPGLIDMHSHVSDVDIEMLPLQLYLANGVTTIRDPGGSVTAARLAQHQIETGKRVGAAPVFLRKYSGRNAALAGNGFYRRHSKAGPERSGIPGRPRCELHQGLQQHQGTGIGGDYPNSSQP